MNYTSKAKGVIINTCYRRPAVLRALIINFKDTREEEEERKCTVIYLDREQDPCRAGGR